MKGNVCRFLLSQGFVSAYDIAHPYIGHIVDNCKVIFEKKKKPDQYVLLFTYAFVYVCVNSLIIQ